MAAVYRFREICKFVVADTCSIQNVCASKTFFGKSVSAGFEYNIPDYVLYEAVRKPLRRAKRMIEDQRTFIAKLISEGKIHRAKLTIDDLQEMSTLRSNKPNLGKGELACIVYSKNKPLAVLTDDKAARNYTKRLLGENKAFESAEIVACMVFDHTITDSECMDIINEERQNNTNMEKAYLEAYNQALMGAMYEKQ